MRVFIIDDEEVSIFILRNIMLLEGVVRAENVTSFLSSEEALAVLQTCSEEELPDVLLLDLSMPVVDGWQFLEQLSPLRNKFKNRCCIYILTSSIVPSDEKRANENPMVAGFIHKPIRVIDIKRLFA